MRLGRQLARTRSKKDLRCFCKGEPLLAKYGVDRYGKLYVHVRVYKQREIYAEVLVTDGTVSILCRYCSRWHRVIIRQSGVATLAESTAPEVLETKPA
jgi:hypothetical protein